MIDSAICTRGTLPLWIPIGKHLHVCTLIKSRTCLILIRNRPFSNLFPFSAYSVYHFTDDEFPLIERLRHDFDSPSLEIAYRHAVLSYIFERSLDLRKTLRKYDSSLDDVSSLFPSPLGGASCD